MCCTYPGVLSSRSLVPVTQLYVSVDASTKDSLKKIDRPLFKDFWPRFLESLQALGEKVSPRREAPVKLVLCFLSFQQPSSP